MLHEENKTHCEYYRNNLNRNSETTDSLKESFHKSYFTFIFLILTNLSLLMWIYHQLPIEKKTKMLPAAKIITIDLELNYKYFIKWNRIFFFTNLKLKKSNNLF